MSLFSVTTAVEDNDLFHMSRLLLLINAFATASQRDQLRASQSWLKLDFSWDILQT